MSVAAPASTSREWSLRAALARGEAVTAAAFVAVSGLAMLIVSPRFTIGGLSLVDDWSAYSKSPHALERLLRVSYDPAAVGDPHRYRPASIAVCSIVRSGAKRPTVTEPASSSPAQSAVPNDLEPNSTLPVEMSALTAATPKAPATPSASAVSTRLRPHSSARAPQCDPPYTIDESGVRRYKLECAR